MNSRETVLRSIDNSAVADNGPLNLVSETTVYDEETGEPQDVQDLNVVKVDQPVNIAAAPWKE